MFLKERHYRLTLQFSICNKKPININLESASHKNHFALFTDLAVYIRFYTMVDIAYDKCVSHIVAQLNELGHGTRCVRFVSCQISSNIIYHSSYFFYGAELRSELPIPSGTPYIVTYSCLGNTKDLSNIFLLEIKLFNELSCQY